MSEAAIAEYVELCSQLACVAPDEVAEQRLYNRLDRLWYVEMSSSDRIATALALCEGRDPCLARRTMSTIDKRFFHVDDGGASYYLVARDLDHAKQLLRDSGVEFTADDGYSYPIDAPEVASAQWREISTRDAAMKRVMLGDDGTPPQSVLAACDVGDWFTSEI